VKRRITVITLTLFTCMLAVQVTPAFAQQVAPPVPLPKPPDILTGPLVIPAPRPADVQRSSPTQNGSPTGPSSTQPPPADTTAPPPTPAPTNPLAQINPGQLLTLFSGLLVGLFNQLLTGARDGLAQAITDTDLVRQTPARWVWGNTAVSTLEAALRTVANGTLALILFWLGLTMATRPFLGDAGPSPLAGFPRLLLALVLANAGHVWMPQAITLLNAVCVWIWSVSVADSNTLGALLNRVVRPDQAFLLALLSLLCLLVTIWLYLKHALRLALLVVLYVLSPLAQVCWALPQTQSLFRAWHQLFWSRLAAQLVAVVALKLALAFAITAGDSPVAVLLTLCLLLVAASAPEMLGLTSGGLSLGSVLQTTAAMTRAVPTPAAPATRVAGSAAGAAGGTAASAAPAVARVGTPGSGVPVSGQAHGTGSGSAATHRGRGGRTPATAKADGGARFRRIGR